MQKVKLWIKRAVGLVPHRIRGWFFHVVYHRGYKRISKRLARNFRRIVQSNTTIEKRILAVSDFSVTDTAIGLFIEYTVRLLCEAYIRGVHTIDFAFVYDPDSPSGHWKYSKWVTSKNFKFHLAELLPVININQKLGSTFIFDNRPRFESFLKSQKSTYYLCPTFSEYISGESVARGNFAFLRDFYLKYNFIPTIEFSPAMQSWARAFIKAHAHGKYVVTVNLRNNPFFADHRNAIVEAWADFFSYCLKERDDVIFFVAGRATEVVDSFKELPNVIFLKNHNTTVEQDLAILSNSLLYMGNSSGPASIAFLGNKIPYIITSFITPDIHHNYSWLTKGSRFPWQDEKKQKLFWERETSELLRDEFHKVFEVVEKEQWRTDIDSTSTKILSWPFTE